MSYTKRYVSSYFWEDEYIAELDIDEKLLFLYLLTNQNTDISGAYKITIRRMSFDTGIAISRVKTILAKFEEAGKIYYCKEFVILPQFPKYQTYNRNMLKSAITSLLSNIKVLIKCDGFMKLVENLQEVGKGFGDVLIELISKINELNPSEGLRNHSEPFLNHSEPFGTIPNPSLTIRNYSEGFLYRSEVEDKDKEEDKEKNNILSTSVVLSDDIEKKNKQESAPDIQEPKQDKLSFSNKKSKHNITAKPLDVIILWNEIADRYDLQKTRPLEKLKGTKELMKKIKARHMTLDEWREYFETITLAPYTRPGQGGEEIKGWRASLTWALRPKTFQQYEAGHFDQYKKAKAKASKIPDVSYLFEREEDRKKAEERDDDSDKENRGRPARPPPWPYIDEGGVQRMAFRL